MRLRNLLLPAIGAVLLNAGVAHADGGPIMQLSQVHGGMDCTAETVVQGTTISSFNVHVLDVVQDPQQGPRILINVSGPAVDTTGVAAGFSGSPVFCDDGTGTMRNAGAISETVGEYGNKVALVTPIEQLLGEPISPPSSAPRLAIRGRPLLGPLTVGGLSPALQALVERAGKRAGRTIVALPSSSSLSFPVQDLVPGASVATLYSTGAIPVGAVGTVTYRDGKTVYAFGHPLDGVGRRSLILADAYVYYVVNNPEALLATSYKLASPGHPLGTLTADTPNAVIGQLGGGPSQTPVEVTARDLDTGHRISLRTQVADETDIGNPTGASLLSLVAPLEVAQAAGAIYDGAPSNESGHMCLALTLRESPEPLRFCNRYVAGSIGGGSGQLPPVLSLLSSTDAATALGLLDAETFAQLHVTHMTVHLDAERGLREATILSAAAPHRVKAGQQVRVRLTVRRYRAALRTISFRVRIPRSARGRVVARIGSGSQFSSAEAVGNALASALFGSSIGVGGPSPRPPGTIPLLRKAFAKVGAYDGLEIRFGHRKPRHAFRSSALLITGSAKLVFNVAK